MDTNDLINQTMLFVKQQLENAEGGHDWFHIERVYNNALSILEKEKADVMVVKLAALLHDIADSKFHKGDDTIGPRIAREFLESQKVNETTIEQVVNIIENVSYKGGAIESPFHSQELEIVQDADRLDAMGAIGIARTFNYGGFKNRPLYNPAIAPKMNMTPQEYKNSTAPTVNHFYEKLLLLKDLMNTETGKQMAPKRHRFMETFLSQFYGEWEGNQ